jgi:hypothetical protein
VDQLWVAHITYIRLEVEFVYLAVILDAFSRREIGWALERGSFRCEFLRHGQSIADSCESDQCSCLKAIANLAKPIRAIGA